MRDDRYSIFDLARQTGRQGDWVKEELRFVPLVVGVEDLVG